MVNKRPTQRKNDRQGTFKVAKAALVGVSWPERRISSKVLVMPPEVCKQLRYYLNRRIAWTVSSAKPNGEGWSQLVCWPGWGMFLVAFEKEDDLLTPATGT